MIVFPVSFIKAPSSSLFTIATFTDVGTTTWVAPPNVNNIEYLVVGGGGGAGNGYDNAGGGGGGAGMVLTGTLSVTPGQSYNITVGAGGAGGIGDQSTTPPGRTNAAGSAGLNSSFSSITALGGGQGLGSRTGGVAGVAQDSNISSATGGSGSGGGNGGKGGGGASTSGSNNSGASGGTGGSGVSNSISGSSVTYGVGGAGGSSGAPTTNGTNGTANSGNGGSGGRASAGAAGNGGNGGSGIVIIRNLSVTFSQAFVNGVAPISAVETAWNTFRAALTGSYTTFVWSSTNGSSLTVTDPVKVQTLANNLRNGTAGSVIIGSTTWLVGVGCGSPKIGGIAVEFSNIGSCSASSTYALRPQINNQNWGGTNQSTVNAPSQTITLTFF